MYKSKPSALLLSLLSIFVFPLSILASDWTEFRGPGGQGHADNLQLPKSWSETENIRWKVSVPGTGWSSPVTGAGQIFLTTAVASAADDSHWQLRVICLNAADGAEVWSTDVFELTSESKVEIHDKNSHASPTPILDDGRLYVHFGPHGTACLSTDGEVLWRNETLTYLPQHGNGGSPALHDGRLFICCDGKDARFVVALDKNTGTQIWRTERELNPSRGFSFCTPTVIESAGRAQVICPGSGGVWAYDSDTGKQIWMVNYGEGYSVVPRPVFGHGLVFVCSGFGDAQLFAIDPSGTGDVTESHVKWKVKKGVPKSPSILLIDNEIYMVDDKGVASCLDASSGELHWQHRLGGGFSASPTFADGVIYFQNETGQTTVVTPGKEYREVSRNQIGDGKLRTFASFAFVDNAILLRNETHLYRIESKNP